MDVISKKLIIINLIRKSFNLLNTIFVTFCYLICLKARPHDYADEYLESYPMVSFHKHWMIDPIEVYRHWLYQDSSFGHDEL